MATSQFSKSSEHFQLDCIPPEIAVELLDTCEAIKAQIRAIPLPPTGRIDNARTQGAALVDALEDDLDVLFQRLAG